MSNEAVEYVRGIPVVKTFGQTVFSFKSFKASIDSYERWVIAYTKQLRLPMMFYTAAINGVFAFLIAGGCCFTRRRHERFLLNLIFYIVITPVISVYADEDHVHERECNDSKRCAWQRSIACRIKAAQKQRSTRSIRQILRLN